MELDQWIAVYQAISQTASDHERSLWGVFSGTLIAACLFALIIVSMAAFGRASLERAAALGVVSFGAAISLVAFLVQARLATEALHWRRLLRDLESQFAGGEFHRSFARLAQGEQICIPAAAWVCNGWNAEPVRFARGVRLAGLRLLPVVPGAWFIGMILLLVRVLID